MKSKISSLSKSEDFKNLLTGKKILNPYSTIFFKKLSSRNNKLLNYLPFMMLVKPMLSRYLNAISLGLKNYVSTGTKVRKNQFGSHPWFSN